MNQDPVTEKKDLMENKVFGQGGKVGETDKLNIDSIIARLLEGKCTPDATLLRSARSNTQPFKFMSIIQIS